VETKGQLHATEWFLLQNLLSAQHVPGHHYGRLCIRVAAYCSSNIPQPGRITYSSTPDQRPVNQSAMYHRQQPSV